MKKFSQWLNEAKAKEPSFKGLGKAAEKVKKDLEKAEQERESLHAYGYPKGYIARKKLYGTPMPKKYRPTRKSYAKQDFPNRRDFEVSQGPKVTPAGKDLTAAIFGDDKKK